MSWKYTYRRECFPDDALVDGCNALGDEGWSLIGPPRWVPPDVRTNLGVWSCFFKRTVSNREQVAEAFSLAPWPKGVTR